MTRRVTALVLALLLALSLSGCWEAEEPEEEDFWNAPVQDEPAADEPLSTISRFTLPYLSAQSFDPIVCIDGVQQTIGALLYEPLFTLDEAFEPQGVLCSDCHCDEPSRVYTFTLRADVRFSDGSALSAQDVLATYRRAAESARYGARFAAVEAMKAVDERTLTITLREANASFCALLDIPIVKAGTEGETAPLGTGPYVFTPGAGGAALTVNSEWRGAQPPLARIELAAVKDNATAQSLFASRSVHLLRLDPTGTDTRSFGGTAAMQNVPTAAMQFLGFNAQRGLTAVQSVRQAMSGVLDREGMVSSLLSGHGTAAQFPLSPESRRYPRALSYHSSAQEYAAALADAGVGANAPRTLTLLVSEENGFRLALAESICAQLSTDALTVELSAKPWEEYLAALEAGRFDLYLGEVRLTADWDIGALIEPDGALNYGGFVSEALCAQFDAFLADGSDNCFAGFAEEMPFAPLLFKSDAVLTPAGLIDGMTPTPSNPFAGLEDWTFHLIENAEN